LEKGRCRNDWVFLKEEKEKEELVKKIFLRGVNEGVPFLKF